MHLRPGCAVAGPARSGSGRYSGGPDEPGRRGIIASIAADGAIRLPRMRRYSLVKYRSCASLVFAARCSCSGLANRCVRPFIYSERGWEIMARRAIPMGGSCPETIGREISPPGAMGQPPGAALMRRRLRHLNETRCGASLNGGGWSFTTTERR